MALARFLAETSLDKVARRLRFLGYDVVTLHGARLEELYEAAREEERIVLSLSGRHPRKFADVELVQVPRGDVASGVRQIAEAYEPSSLPFSRCPRCNHALQKRHPLEARGEVPGRVGRMVKTLMYCPICAQWFWYGSHVERMCKWLSVTLGREIAWPHDSPGGDLVTPP